MNVPLFCSNVSEISPLPLPVCNCQFGFCKTFKYQSTYLALSKERDNINALPREKALVYSFLPTEDVSGLGVLVNSDFSTDPSRRHLIKDEITHSNIKDFCTLYKSIFISNIYGNDRESRNIIKALTPYSEASIIQFTGNHFETIFYNEIKTVLDLTNVLFRPSWLNSTDYNTIINRLGRKGIDTDDENSMQPSFLKYLGAKELSVEEISKTDVINNLNLSLSGCLQISSQLIKKSLFYTDVNSDSIIKLCLFYCNNERKSLLEIDQKDGFIDESFLESLLDTGLSKSDIKQIFKRYNLNKLLQHLNKNNNTEQRNEIKQEINFPDTESTTSNVNNKQDKDVQINDSINESTKSTFNDWYKIVQSNTNENAHIDVPVAPKWRNAEQQVLYFLNKNGFYLNDVSQQNLGYDLEGTDSYGNKVYIEVKSIKYPGQSFKMTNNEYAIALQKCDSFLIAIAYITEHELKLSLLKDPVNSLKFNRQCTQWVWECNEYTFNPHIFEL